MDIHVDWAYANKTEVMERRTLLHAINFNHSIKKDITRNLRDTIDYAEDE